MICFIEGPEGTGKSTLAKKLAEQFKGLYVNDPGYTLLGKRLRQLLKFDMDVDINPVSQMLLFSAGIADTFYSLRDKIKNNVPIFFDRTYISTIVYQCIVQKVMPVNQFIEMFLDSGIFRHPHLIIYLMPESTLETQDCLARAREASGQSDRFEDAGFDFHKGLFDGYNTIITEMKKFWIADQHVFNPIRYNQDEIFHQVSPIVATVIENKVKDESISSR